MIKVRFIASNLLYGAAHKSPSARAFMEFCRKSKRFSTIKPNKNINEVNIFTITALNYGATPLLGGNPSAQTIIPVLKAVCKTCGREFEYYYRNGKKRDYCSHKCKDSA